MEVFTSLTVLVLGVAYFAMARRLLPLSLGQTGRFPSVVWKTPEALVSIGVALFFLLMAAMSFGKPPGKIDLQSLYASLALYGSIVLLLIGVLVFQDIDPRKAFGLQWRDWRQGIWLVPTVLILILPPIYAAQWLAYNLFAPDAAPQPIVTFLIEKNGWGERLVVIAIAVVAAPVTEELVFRGCLYGVLRQVGGRAVAIIVTSVLFALIHAHLASMPGLLMLAVCLSLIYEFTGSLWAPIALHALFNAT
jgi:membrane protease YdiL (CAAX protease family)